MDIRHIAQLANLPLKSSAQKKLQRQFDQTLAYVAKINELDLADVSPISQVTGLSNVTRTDIVDHSRILSQNQALSAAKRTYKGYFIVPSIFDAS